MNRRLRQTLNPTQIVILSFAVVIVLGTILLSLPIATVSGERLAFEDAFFTAVSATCVTGLIGVDEVIHPEKDMAILLANKLGRTDVVDFLPLMPGYSIIEIKTPPEFVGRSLAELSLRNKLNVQLIGIEKPGNGRKNVNIMPRAEDVLDKGDLLIILGADRDLDRIKEIVRNMPNGN